MKKYMFRRIVAGAMALLTVAAYTPLADFTALQQPNAIVAVARDAALKSKSLTETAWEKGDYFEEDAEFITPDGTTIDLSFANATYNSDDRIYEVKDSNGTVILTIKFTGEGIGAYDSNTLTIAGVKSAKYVSGTTGKLEVVFGGAGNNGGAIVTVANGYYLAVNNADSAAANSGTYGLEAKKTADTYMLNTTDNSMKNVITSLSFTDEDGIVQTLDATASRGTYDVMAKTVVTITSGALLKFDGNDSDMDDYLDRTASDFENAKYVYKFNMLEGRKIIAETQAVKFALANGTDDPEKLELNNGDEITYSVGKTETTYTHSSSSFDDSEALKGGLVTVSSATPFRIDTGKYELQTGVAQPVPVYTYGVYADGMYTATFVNSVEENKRPGFENNVLIQFIHHEHTLSYSGKNTDKLTASCGDGDLINATVATVYAEVPSTTAGVDADQLANNSTIPFTEESDEMANLVFEVDPNLLATSGNAQGAENNRYYVATVAMGDYKFTYTLPSDYVIDATSGNYGKSLTDDSHVAEHKITPRVYKKGSNGKFSTTEMTSDQLSADNIDLAKFKASPRTGATDLTQGFVLPQGIFFTKGGNYTASLEVYNKDTVSGAMTVNYKYTVAPSEAINEDAMEVLGGYYGGEAKVISLTDAQLEEIKQSNFTSASATAEGIKNNDTKFTVYQGSTTDTIVYITKDEGTLPAQPSAIGLSYNIKGGWVLLTSTEWDAIKGNYTPVLDVQYTERAVKNADGVYEFAIDKSRLTDNFWVTFKFKKLDKNGKFTGEYYPEEYYAVNGENKGNILDRVYHAAVEVKSASYKQDEALEDIKWTLVEAEEQKDLYYGVSDAAVDYMYVEEQLKSYLKTTREDIDVTKAKFQYMTLADYQASEANGNVDLDALHDGVPQLTEAQMDAPTGVNKEFVVYASVGSVTTAYPIHIYLRKAVATPVHAVLNKLVYEYGERITLDDLSFFTETGTEVTFDKKDITDQGTKGDGKVDNTLITFKPLDSQGRPGAAVKVVDTNPNTGEVYFLDPGKYQVILSNGHEDGACVKFSEQNTTKGYSFAEEEDITNPDVVTYTITVNKRTIDPTMFGDYTADLNETAQAKVTNTTYSKSNGNIFLPDAAMNDLTVTIKSGVSSTTKAGTYTVVLEPTGNSKYYYTGTASVNWYATKTDMDDLPELIWNKTKQNIYRGTDGTIQVHVEAFQALNTIRTEGEKAGASITHGEEYDNDVEALANTDYLAGGIYTGDNVKAVRATTPSTITKSFGLVFDKTQTFPKDADPDDVAKALKLDANGGFKGQKATNATIADGVDSKGNKTKSGCTTGLNFTVNSVDDYYWVRPYVTVDGGVPKYGEPILVDFQTIAQEVLQPTLDSVKLVQKTVSGKEGLYYYVYATKYTRNNDGDRTIQPDRWGIVLDRTGNYGATVADDKFDYEALTLENCDAHSEALKNSTKYTEDEVGTLIKITDSLSRVYVRNYIDFGNGLVVYNKKPTDGLVGLRYVPNKDGLKPITPEEYEKLGDDKALYHPEPDYDKYKDKYFTESASATLAEAIGLGTQGGLYNKDTPSDATATKDTVAMAAVRTQGNNDKVTIPARPTLNTKANAQQVFDEIVIDNRETGAEAENKLTGWGVVVDRTGAAYNVWEEKYKNKSTPVDFFTTSDYKAYNATNVNKDNYTDDSITGVNKYDSVVYALSVSAPEGKTVYTYRAVAEYKGVTIYGDVWFANKSDAKVATRFNTLN